MLSGLKFIPRDEIEKAPKKAKKKSGSRRDRDRKRKKKSPAGSSSEDNLDRIDKGSRKKKKWYSSNDDVSTSSVESESDNEPGNEPDHDQEHRKKKAAKKRDDGGDASGSNTRADMGLEWMLRPKNNMEEIPATVSDNNMPEFQAAPEDRIIEKVYSKCLILLPEMMVIQMRESMAMVLL